MKVTVLGLGLMGSGIARNLKARGHEVHGYNRTREKTKPLQDLGVSVHSSPIEAVEYGADVAITMLTDQDAVREVAFGRDGFIRGLRRGSLWIDMSTILPEASVDHAREAEKLGVERLDAPVIGGPLPASRGELIIVVGGKRTLFDRYLGLLEQMGKEVAYIGPDGSGHKMKLAFNLFLAVLATGFSEALTFAQKIGIEPADFVATVNKTPHRNSYTENKGVRVSRNEFSPTFTLRMMRKDLALIHSESLLNNISLPLTSTVLDLYTAAMNQGLAELDYSSIVMMLQRLNGINTR